MIPPDEAGPVRFGAARRLARGAAALLLLALLAGLAYFQMFSTFALYDDEGYMMLTVRHALAGHRLYEDVWTLYGPVYFLYKWLLHGLAGLPLTHDVVRLTALTMRLLIGATAALATWRLTRSAALAALTLALVTFHLATLNFEPGHPQELCGLLLMLLVTVPSFGIDRGRAWMPVALGLIVAALTMTKVNVGVFAGLAVWMAFLSLIPLGGGSAALRLASAAALAALPWLLMRPLLDRPAAQYFATTEMLAVLACAAIALTRRDGPSRLGALVWFAATWIAGIGLAALAMRLMGTSLSALLDSLVLSPARMPALFIVLPADYFPVPFAAAAALVVALGLRAARGSRAERHLVGLAALAIGCTALIAAWRDDRPTLLSGVTPFLWVGLLAPSGAAPSRRERLARHVLCWAAVLQPLQAFPVAGSQSKFGTVLHILVGVLCVADGMGWLRSLSAHLTRPRLRTAAAALPTVAAALLWLAVIGAATQALRLSRARYDALVPIGMPGATRLHVTPAVRDVVQSLTQQLREGSDTFLSVPGFSSLYFWTGKEPPTLDVIGHTMAFYSPERQAAMVEGLLRHERPMVLRFKGIAATYQPFDDRLNPHFEVLQRVGYYLLLVERKRPIGPAAAPP